MTDIIEVVDIVENEDGSSTITFELGANVRENLIRIGLLHLIEKACEEVLDVDEVNIKEIDTDD